MCDFYRFLAVIWKQFLQTKAEFLRTLRIFYLQCIVVFLQPCDEIKLIYWFCIELKEPGTGEMWLFR